MSEEEESQHETFTVLLILGPVQRQLEIPRRMKLSEFARILLDLDSRLIDDALRRDEATASRISCRAGCGACCRQRVPISIAEACMIAELLDTEQEDRQARLLAKYEAAQRILQAHPVAFAPGGEEDYFRLGIACPFLEQESCSIHPSRPAACRQHLVTTPSSRCANLSAGAECVEIHARMEHMLASAVSRLISGPLILLPLVSIQEWSAENQSLIVEKWDARELLGSLDAAFRSEGGIAFSWSIVEGAGTDGSQQPVPHE